MSASPAHAFDDDRRHHLLTIALEDYFHATALGPLIPVERWERFESRVERNTLRTLDLLDEYGVRATFFALGWVADRVPEVLAEVVRRGHEVASKGYYHRTIQQMSATAFREDSLRARDAIERATDRRVLGYRVAQGSIGLEDLWALDALAEQGFAYDSSIYPRLRSIAAQPWRRFPHHHTTTDGGDIFEFPLSSCGTDELLLPSAGGNVFRQLPMALVQRAVAHWDSAYTSPFNMHFHIWELDPELPRITAAGWLTRMRQYRNIRRMPDVLRGFFERYRFVGLARHLELEQEPLPAPVVARPKRADGEPLVVVGPLKSPTREATGDTPQGTPSGSPSPRRRLAHRAGRSAANDLPTTAWVDDAPHAPDRPRARREAPAIIPVPVTLVVPCFNEELIIPYLANTLRKLDAELCDRYALRFVFVDDASNDRTWEVLHETFGASERCRLVRHASNRGVAAAITTGLREAETEIVVSADCDCTYDPRQLQALVPLLGEDVDMVTASPYHPLGSVVNVPRWRLALSRGLSRLYRAVLHHQLHTYTSCFRAYRRERVLNLPVRHGGFLGVAEMLAQLDLAGGRIVECPAVLEVRLLGHSKMKLAGTIFGHLRLLGRLALRRFAARATAIEPTIRAPGASA